MTRDELIAALQALPDNLTVCVTTDANRETYEAQLIEVTADDGGPIIVITGLEDLEGVFGPRPDFTIDRAGAIRDGVVTWVQER